MRAIIISEPKSGTYLCSALLKHLGMYQTFFHLFETSYSAYDKNDLLEGRNNPRKYLKAGNIQDVVTSITDNGFAVTHEKRKELMVTAFASFKKVVVTRPLKEKKASHNRWITETPRGNSGYQTNHSLWLADPETFHIEFKDMIEINVEKIDALQVYLFGSIITDSAEAMNKALNEETLTKSSKRRGE